MSDATGHSTPPVLPYLRQGDGDTTVVLLHYFGSSKRAWDLVMPVLCEKFACVAIDLPGFGEAADVGGYSVAEMAAAVRRTVDSLNVGRRVLVGHSMSGKVAAVLASQGMDELAGLVLVTPSPPEPEPMTEGGRVRLMGFGRNAHDAEQYLDGITAEPLRGRQREYGVEDFVRCSCRAWAAWLGKGSREDWADRVGTLTVPSFLITGKKDPSLGLAAQQKTTMRHLTDPLLEDIAHCGHVPMLETPGRLAGCVARFVEGL